MSYGFNDGKVGYFVTLVLCICYNLPACITIGNPGSTWINSVERLAQIGCNCLVQFGASPDFVDANCIRPSSSSSLFH